jgi:ribosome biogenesis GTPase / thiamine phosphate phosphatase
LFDSSNVPTLAQLGWDDRLDAALRAVSPDLVPARVARVDGRRLIALSPSPRTATVSGRLLEPGGVEGGLTAGDWVALRGELAVDMLPRRTVLLRHVAGRTTAAQAVAANLDAVLVAAPLDGGVRSRRIERSLALAWSSGATPIVLLTKADLSDDLDADLGEALAVSAGAEVVALSAVDGTGVGRLRALLRPGQTAGIIGPSGAGKSTLVNLLAGEEVLATAAVRDDGRGRHTTTHRQLVLLPGGALLVDTPGMRELGLWDADDGIDRVFADLADLAEGCRFSDCSHEREPGCAVQAAAEADARVLERLASRRKLEREQRRLDLQQDARARAEANRALRRWVRSIRQRAPR